MLLVISYDVFQHIRILPVWRVALAALLPIVAVSITTYTKTGDFAWYVYAVTLALLAVYLIWILLYRLGKKRALVIRNVIIGIGVAEMAASAVYGVCCNGTVSKSSYVEAVSYTHLDRERQPCWWSELSG